MRNARNKVREEQGPQGMQIDNKKTITTITTTTTTTTTTATATTTTITRRDREEGGM